MEEISVIRPYSAFKLLEFAKTFKVSVKEPVTALACEAVGCGSRWDQVWLLWRQEYTESCDSPSRLKKRAVQPETVLGETSP